MGFNDITRLGQQFSETAMGESFSYTSPSGSTVLGLTGVFNQVEVDFQFDEHSTRAVTQLICVASKTQWGATVPANRGVITYGGIGYSIDRVNGAQSTGEPAYELTCKRLT